MELNYWTQNPIQPLVIKVDIMYIIFGCRKFYLKTYIGLLDSKVIRNGH